MLSLPCVEPTWRCVLGRHCSRQSPVPLRTEGFHFSRPSATLAALPPTYSFVLSKYTVGNLEYFVSATPSISQEASALVALMVSYRETNRTSG
jgi:hypothetical protein